MPGERNQAQPTDQALVERAQADPAEFGALYDRYLDDIYVFCARRLRTRELAEDATSQIFLQALAALPRFRAHSFRAWLYTIARNVVVDVHRARWTMPLDDALATHPLIAEDELPRITGALDLQQLLDQLTPDQREVVELRLAGMGSQEIAEVLDRTPGSVRALQFRAYQQLRALIASAEVTT